jgi:hypothetical protein
LNPDVLDVSVPSTQLFNAIRGLGRAVSNNRESVVTYKDAVQNGLQRIAQEIDQIVPLINSISRKLVQARAANDPALIASLQMQKQKLIDVINSANLNIRQMLDGDPDNAEAVMRLAQTRSLNPDILTRNLDRAIASLQSARERATRADPDDVVDEANIAPDATLIEQPGQPGIEQDAAAKMIKNRPTKPMSSAALRQKRAQASKKVNPNPFVSDAQNYYNNVPGANRRGGKMRKTKRHQKKSRKTNKKKSKKTANKTAKKGKIMRGGYSYGKSKRRRGRSSPSSSVPSSLSGYSKNVILF